MDIPDCYYRVSAKALILNDQKQFMLFKEQKGVWDLPGGGIEFGEDPIEALKREIKEESGLTVKKVNPSPSYFITFKGETPKAYFANIIYFVELRDFNIKNSKECVEIGFFNKKLIKDIRVYDRIRQFAKIYDKSRH